MYRFLENEINETISKIEHESNFWGNIHRTSSRISTKGKK